MATDTPDPRGGAQDGARFIPPPPEQRPLENILRPIPTDQFDRGIDLWKTSPYGGGGGTTTGDWPLKLKAASTTQIIVVFGTVNGFTPTNVATNITVSGTNGTWNTYLDATVDATTGAVSAVTITSNTSAVPADTSTHSYRLIGQTVVAAAVISSVSPALAWSQEFVACTPGTTSSYHWLVA